MLYLIALALLTVISYFLARSFFAEANIKKAARLSGLRSEYEELSLKFRKVKDGNIALENNVAETIALYDVTKDMSRELDQDKIFGVFKERINNYIKVKDCRFLGNEDNPDRHEGYLSLPLVINKEAKGYLVAGGIEEKDKGRFQILARQLLVMLKRAFLYKKVQELAIMDGLTQVFGRRHFLERLDEEARRSRKFKYNFSFIMADIDKFKGFNDKYGHLVGDAILREVSGAVRETVRQIDFVGRYGGEELAIVLPETDKEQALFAAERIRRAVETREIKVYDEELRVTISVGISTFPDDAGDCGLLIEAADKALYSAKGAGRNRVCAYHK